MKRLCVSFAVLGSSAGFALAQNVATFCDYPSWSAAAGSATSIETFASVPFDWNYELTPVVLPTGTLSVTAMQYTGGNVIETPPFLTPIGGGLGDNGTNNAHCWVRVRPTGQATQVEFALNAPAKAFGATLWSALGAGAPLELELRLGSNLVGIVDVQNSCWSQCNGAGCPQDVFFGVDVTAPLAFDRIVFRASPSAPSNNGRPFAMDDLNIVRADCTPPFSYCSSGTTQHGCAATLTATGTASATNSNPFVLHVAGADPQQGGYVFYGTQGVQALPWSATSTSTLCVKLPLQRTPGQNTGGTPGLCDGTLQLDWNAFVSSHPTALGLPAQLGDRFWAQAWVRDPQAPKTSSLSDAQSFQLCP